MIAKDWGDEKLDEILINHRAQLAARDIRLSTTEGCRAHALEIARELIAKSEDEGRSLSGQVFGACGADRSFSFAYGVICVPALSREKDHQFSFAQLAKEIRAEERGEALIEEDGQLLMVPR